MSFNFYAFASRQLRNNDQCKIHALTCRWLTAFVINENQQEEGDEEGDGEREREQEKKRHCSQTNTENSGHRSCDRIHDTNTSIRSHAVIWKGNM